MSGWKYAMSDSGNRALIADEHGETVASVSNRTHDNGFEAKVRLFTAAHDLVVALEIHHDWCAKYQPGYCETGGDAVAFRATLAAINKARGRK